MDPETLTLDLSWNKKSAWIQRNLAHPDLADPGPALAHPDPDPTHPDLADLIPDLADPAPMNPRNLHIKPQVPTLC